MFIFITNDKSGRSHIYHVNEDGSGLVCVTSEFAFYHSQCLTLSPNRNRYLFRARPQNEIRMPWFLVERGKPGLRVYGHEPEPSLIIWLSNTEILCLAPRDPDNGLSRETSWKASIEGESQDIPIELGDHYPVAAQDDGRTLLLGKGHRSEFGVLFPGIGGGVYLGDIGTDGTVQFTEVVNPNEYERSHKILRPLCWTPDGSAITCLGGHEDEIWTVEMDGSNPQKVLSGDYFWMSFRWSPNGKKVAFMRSLDGGGPSATRAAMYIMDVGTGTEHEVLVRSRGDGPWGWSSDSQRIIEVRIIEGETFLAFTHISDGVAETPIPLGSHLPNPTDFITL